MYKGELVKEGDYFEFEFGKEAEKRE